MADSVSSPDQLLSTGQQAFISLPIIRAETSASPERCEYLNKRLSAEVSLIDSSTNASETSPLGTMMMAWGHRRVNMMSLTKGAQCC